MTHAARLLEVIAFTLLALTLPVAIQANKSSHADSMLLAWTVWAIFAAGIAAVLHRWDQPLSWETTVPRVLAIVLGLTYVVRNFPRGRSEREDWSLIHPKEGS
jgi:hypothetical protein